MWESSEPGRVTGDDHHKGDRSQIMKDLEGKI
jgi:hypothetical protein